MDLFAKICQFKLFGRYDTRHNTQKLNITILSMKNLSDFSDILHSAPTNGFYAIIKIILNFI